MFCRADCESSDNHKSLKFLFFPPQVARRKHTCTMLDPQEPANIEQSADGDDSEDLVSSQKPVKVCGKTTVF